MKKKTRYEPTMEELLQSMSDVLYPDQMGMANVEITSRDSEGDTPLHVVMWRQDHYGAELLIESGADINAIGDMGETPLHVAISKEDLFLINILLRKGTRTDIGSEFGETAIKKAREKGGKIWQTFKENGYHS